MRTVKISNSLLSPAIWRLILSATAFHRQAGGARFFERLDDLEKLRRQAGKNTGSISVSSAWLLFSLASYFAPARVLEIGTFIGRSALSLALGAEHAGAPCELHTCDLHNDMPLPAPAGSTIVQYGKMMSTDMLAQIAKQAPSPRFDMFHIDGRLADKDCSYLRDLLAEDVVVAIDDFDGVQKGVVNYMKIQAMKLLPHHILVYPCESELLQRYGLLDASTTALLLPQSAIKVKEVDD
jgi:predicted O-methyltransferase YrrM